MPCYCMPTRSYTPSCWPGLALGTGSSCMPGSLPMRQNGRPGSEVKVRLRSMRWWASMENGSAGGRMSFSAFSFVKAQPQHAVFVRAHCTLACTHAHVHKHTCAPALTHSIFIVGLLPRVHVFISPSKVHSKSQEILYTHLLGMHPCTGLCLSCATAASRACWQRMSSLTSSHSPAPTKQE